MIDVLVGAVGSMLHEKWGDEYEVYTEKVYQGAKRPCFFVECEKTEKINLLGGRFFVRADIKVTLENDSDTKIREADALIDSIFSLLNFVDVGERRIFGRRINAKWENGSMVVRSVYDVSGVIEETEGDLMEKITVKERYRENSR